MNRIRISKPGDRRVPGNTRWIRGVLGTNGKTKPTVSHLTVEDKRTKNAGEWVRVEWFSDYVARYDQACERAYVNPGLLKLSKSDAPLIDSRPSVYPGGEQGGRYERCIRTVFDSGEDAECESAWKPDGASGRYMQIRPLAERDANGYGTGVLAVGRDITECKRRELLETARAELSERLMAGAELAEVLSKTASVVELSFPSLSCQILVPDEWGSLTLSGGGSWLPLRCRAADQQSGFTLMDIKGGIVGAQHMQEVCLGGTDFSLHSEVGGFRDVMPCRVVPVLSGEGEVICIFVVKGPEMPEAEVDAATDTEAIYELVRNVVNRCRTVAEVGLEIANDPPPRMLDRDVLSQNLASVLDWDCPLVLFIVALDNLHQVNDSLGRGAVDRILKDSVRRLRLAMGGTEFLAHTGNDELVVALQHIGDLSHVKRMAECMRGAVSGYYVLEGGGRLWTSVSVGVALYPDHGREASELLSYANQALIAAKGDGYGKVRVFERSMQESTLMQMRLAKDLSVALREGQLSLHYQPIFDYAHEKICKAEALLRWRHPQLGEVSPALFVPIAEANGLIHEIGNWVFREAARVSLEWNRRSESDVPHRICINRSPTQFFAEEDIERWSECLAAQQIPGEYLSVEITEGLLLDDRPGVHEQLRQIRAMGMTVALDDFGTGYSALSYLKKFEIDYLKIDRSFIRGIVSDPRDWAIVESIITMARRLGIRLIAEGVETREQAILLSQAGCDMAQGYLYARPMPEREFLEFSSVWSRHGY